MIKSDVIIVGGGPVGCVLAERISSILNFIDKKPILNQVNN